MLAEDEESRESVELVRVAFLRSLGDGVSDLWWCERQLGQDILGRAVLEGAFPGLATSLDSEADALVVTQGGRASGRGGGSGLSRSHCEGLCGGGGEPCKCEKVRVVESTRKVESKEVTCCWKVEDS